MAAPLDFADYHRVRPSASGTQLIAPLAVMLAGLLSAAALVVLARRLAGAFTLPPQAGPLVLTIVIGTALAVTIHRLIRSPAVPANYRPLAKVGDVAADVALVLLALSLTFAESAAPALVIAWLAVIAEVVWSRHSSHPGRFDKSAQEILPLVPQPESREEMSAIALLSDDSSSDESEIDESATQHISYRRTPAGALSVTGWQRLQFEPGQRTAVAHVAFCPAFESGPQVDAEILDGPACQIRPTLVLPWGVRWEVRLDDPAEAPAAAVLGFSAT